MREREEGVVANTSDGVGAVRGEVGAVRGRHCSQLTQQLHNHFSLRVKLVALTTEES